MANMPKTKSELDAMTAEELNELWAEIDELEVQAGGALAGKLKNDNPQKMEQSTVQPTSPIYPSSLRAISLHGPWAYLIMEGTKTIEYRSRSTTLRGTVLVHSSKTTASDDVMKEYDIPECAVIRGAIVGAVDIVKCTGESGSYQYHLKNPRWLSQPVPVAGQQMVFWPANTPERIKAFNNAWTQLTQLGHDITVPSQASQRPKKVAVVPSEVSQYDDLDKITAAFRYSPGTGIMAGERPEGDWFVATRALSAKWRKHFKKYYGFRIRGYRMLVEIVPQDFEDFLAGKKPSTYVRPELKTKSDPEIIG